VDDVKDYYKYHYKVPPSIRLKELRKTTKIAREFSRPLSREYKLGPTAYDAGTSTPQQRIFVPVIIS
jgi:hypothetical protein